MIWDLDSGSLKLRFETGFQIKLINDVKMFYYLSNSLILQQCGMYKEQAKLIVKQRKSKTKIQVRQKSAIKLHNNY